MRMKWVWCQSYGELLRHTLIKRARHDRSFGVCIGCIKGWEKDLRMSIAAGCRSPDPNRRETDGSGKTQRPGGGVLCTVGV